MFTATLDSIPRRLNWDNMVVKTENFSTISALLMTIRRLCIGTPHELQELSGGSRQMGQKMNIATTNMMVVDTRALHGPDM